jgi:hypothetical protein
MTEPKATTTNDLTTLEMFVLDVLRHDEMEALSSVVQLLNDQSCFGWRQHWSHDFTSAEVQIALSDLAGQKKVEILQDDGEGELVAVSSVQQPCDATLWYRLTPAGLAAWDQWDPPV